MATFNLVFYGNNWRHISLLGLPLSTCMTHPLLKLKRSVLLVMYRAHAYRPLLLRILTANLQPFLAVTGDMFYY